MSCKALHWFLCKLNLNNSLHTLKCLQTCSETFWMFKNILKSSNGTLWNISKQILQEHFKKFKKNSNISRNYPEHCELFSNIFHFTLWNVYIFFECSGTFWKVLKETFLNVFKQIIREHFKKFKTFFWTFLAIIQNIVSCSQTFFTSHFEMFTN